MRGHSGGIEALWVILSALPLNFPATVLIQTHLNPTYPSVLVEVLRRRSRLPVIWAEHGAMLCPATVIVAPPGQHVQVTMAASLALTSWDTLGYVKPRADRVFESVARCFKARAIGVILTGYLNDGAQGALAITREGGRVIVENPDSAQVAEMPLAALHTGCADFALSLHAIPAALTSLVMVPGAARFFSVPRNEKQPYRESLRFWKR